MSLASERYRMFSDFSKGIGSDLASVGEQKEREAGLALRTRRAKLEEPVLQERSMEAKDKIDFANADFDAYSLTPKGETDMTMNYLVSDGIGKIADSLNLKHKDGKFIKPDGSVVTNREMHSRFPIVRAINNAIISPGHALDSKINYIKNLEASGKATEEDKAALVELEKLKSDPGFLDRADKKLKYQILSHIDALKPRGVKTGVLEERVKDIDRKIAERKAVGALQSEREFKERLEHIKGGYKRNADGKSYTLEVGDYKIPVNQQEHKKLEGDREAYSIAFSTEKDADDKPIPAPITVRDAYIINNSFDESVNEAISRMNANGISLEEQKKIGSQLVKRLNTIGASSFLTKIAINSIEESVTKAKPRKVESKADGKVESKAKQTKRGKGIEFRLTIKNPLYKTKLGRSLKNKLTIQNPLYDKSKLKEGDW